MCRAAVYSVVVTDVKATPRAAGEEGSGVVETWPLMRNWHHGIRVSVKRDAIKATVIGQWTPHNRTLSRGDTRRKLCISSARKNSLFYDPHISRPRELLRQDFVAKFATYARVYTVRRAKKSKIHEIVQGNANRNNNEQLSTTFTV